MRRVLVVIVLLASALPVPAVAQSAAGECTRITLDAHATEPLPASTGTCPGVRPGALVRSDDLGGSQSVCTFNFVYDGFRVVDGARTPAGRYIGTAGHCVLAGSGEHSWAQGEGPKAYDSSGRHIGHYVYARDEETEVRATDIALIELLPGVEANPQLCHWGGPTGVNDDRATRLVQLRHFGHGNGFGSTIPARTALTASTMNPDEVYATGAAVFGDSGSAVISADGRAVGVLVTVGVHTSGVTSAEYLMGTGNIGITRLTPQLQRAGEVLGLELEVAQAPLLNPTG